MKFVRYDNILAIKTDAGRIVGFHARNMQVAKLDEGVWNALSDDSSTSEERTELELWNKEVDPSAVDADIAVRPRSSSACTRARRCSSSSSMRATNRATACRSNCSRALEVHDEDGYHRRSGHIAAGHLVSRRAAAVLPREMTFV